MTRRHPPTPVLSGATHLLAALPHLIGYRPDRSLVLVVSLLEPGAPAPSTGRARMAMTIRVDLPAPGDAASLVGELVEPITRAVRDRRRGPVTGSRGGAPVTSVALLHAFVHDGDEGVAREILVELQAQLPGAGVSLHDYFLVREERCRPLLESGVPVPDHPGEHDGPDTTACSACWRPLPEAAEVPLVADLVLEGRSPVGSRGELVDRIRSRDEPASAATELALDVLRLDPSRRDPVQALAVLGRWVAGGDVEPDPGDRAAIAVALQDRALRDLVLARWVPDPFATSQALRDSTDTPAWEALPSLPAAAGPGAAGGVHRLLHLAARVPTDLTAPLLTIAAFLAWRGGDGSVANETVELALEHDPTYRLALLLREVLARGIPPWALRGAEVA